MSSQSNKDVAAASSGTLQVEHTSLQVERTTIDQDMARLTQLLAQEPPLDENADIDFQALLHELETANSIAGGVESRLESVIGRLDEMLESFGQNAADAGLEAEAVAVEVEVEAVAVEVEAMAVQVEVTKEGGDTRRDLLEKR